DAVAEVFRIRICTSVNKGQDGKRTDSLAGTPLGQRQCCAARAGRDASSFRYGLNYLLPAADNGSHTAAYLWSSRSFQLCLKLQPLLEPLQIQEQVLDGLIAFFSVFRQRLTHNPLQLGGNPWRVMCERQGLRFQERGDDVTHRGTRK